MKTDFRAKEQAHATDDGRGLFFKNWLLHPLSTAAHVPSSSALAKEMTRFAVDSDAVGPIVEFGPGTGAITLHLLENTKVKATDLVLVEQNPEFCSFLRSRFEGATIIQESVFNALQDLKGLRASAVISSLPMTLFPKRNRIRLVSRCLSRVLVPGGSFTQFTYSLRCPLELGGKTKIEGRPSRRIWRNLPPAVVWRFTNSARAIL